MTRCSLRRCVFRGWRAFGFRAFFLRAGTFIALLRLIIRRSAVRPNKTNVESVEIWLMVGLLAKRPR